MKNRAAAALAAQWTHSSRQ